MCSGAVAARRNVPRCDGDVRYSRNTAGFRLIVRRPIVPAMKRTALDNLPLIDLTPFTAGGSAAQRQVTGQALRRACIDIGFFYLIGHGLADAELDAALDWGRRFFAVPLDDKLKLRLDRPQNRLGYTPVGGANPEYGATSDVKERFSATREVIPGECEEGRFDAGQSQWPDRALPGFGEFFRAHIERRKVLAQQLVRAFAVSLDLPESHFDQAYRHPGCTLMFNYYPSLGAADQTRSSFSPHTDYGAFTLLLQDALGGLEVRNAAGDWIDVPPVDGSFVVNVGDMFAMWTNDLYKSALHRVTNRSGAERISIPMFTYPQGRTEITTLPTCIDAENPAKYPPVIAEDYNRMLVARANLTGRPGIAARTAERLQESGTP